VRAIVAHYGGIVALPTVAGPLVVHRGAAVLDGHVLPLSPTGLEMLRLLVAARGSVVTRERLLDVLPGDSKDPHAVEVAIARLRDASGSRDLVRTVVKRGYRLELADAR
jgi:uroporphyrinogen-III synthase